MDIDYQKGKGRAASPALAGNEGYDNVIRTEGAYGVRESVKVKGRAE